MKIIGLSGTNGAGKDSVGEILSEHDGFLFIPATNMLRDEAKQTGREPNRKTLAEISTGWRHQFGMGAVVDVALQRYEEEITKHHGKIVIASLRHPGEADRIHELGGMVIWVDADPQIRYKRVISNSHLRDRAAEDQKTFEQFIAEEKAEMQHSGDEATLNMSGVKDKADIFLENNGNFDEFKTKVLEKLT